MIKKSYGPIQRYVEMVMAPEKLVLVYSKL